MTLNASLRDLYQEMILDHGKHPRNMGSLPNATHCQSGHNPLCGDQLTLYVEADNDLIKQIKFEGSGCAISVASASLMTEVIQGKSFADIWALFSLFHDMLTTETAIDEEKLDKLTVFAGVKEFPMRVKCATLAWHTLKAALLESKAPVSTENEDSSNESSTHSH